MSALLELEGVVVRAGGSTILDVPSFTVDAGEIVAVLGVNGAGKSTLLRAASLLLRPDEGRVLLDGRPAVEPELRRSTSAVLQRPLLQRRSVARNVEAGLRFQGHSRSAAKRLAGPWLHRLGIAHLRDRHARTLSAGEAQRVSLARALAVGPRLLMLDEAFATLDTPTRVQLVSELGALLRRHDTAALLATHDVREAVALADRLVVLDAGHIGLDVSTADLRTRADQLGYRWLLDPWPSPRSA